MTTTIDDRVQSTTEKKTQHHTSLHLFTLVVIFYKRLLFTVPCTKRANSKLIGEYKSFFFGVYEIDSHVRVVNECG